LAALFVFQNILEGKMNVNSILEFLTWLWTLAGVKFIVYHTAVNLVVAVAAALKVGGFKPYKLAEFLTRKLAPYVLIYGAVKAVGMDIGLEWLSAAAFALIELTLASDLAENLDLLGIPMPEAVRNLVKK
jgi:hypothetical protein